MSMLVNKVSLPLYLLKFGSFFEKARKHLKSQELSVLGVTYKNIAGENRVYHSKSQHLLLSETSSGMQAAIPMLMTLEYFAGETTTFPFTFIVEEPELSLYPNTQKELIYHLVNKCVNRAKGKLILTTHSPCTLTSLNNLIQAHNTANAKPELKAKVKKIIPEENWLSYDQVSAYYLEKGKARNIMNGENRLIDASPLDNVSEELSDEYDKLLDLEYGK